MDNLWARRTKSVTQTAVQTVPSLQAKLTSAHSSSKLSLSTSVNGSAGDSGRHASSSRRPGDSSAHGKSGGFPSTPGSALASPTTGGGGASSAFGLGSGAFASFGSAKTPKTPGNPFDTAMGSAVPKQAAGRDMRPVGKPGNMSSISEARASGAAVGQIHPLKDAWSFWYRPPISKAHGYIEYENTLHGIATMRTAEEFWEIYSHLKRPSSLPVVSDYHLFKKDIRPIWEDDINRKGGKWVVRMKKGVADRYWEDLLLSLIGDQFGDAGEEVCGAVLSMRNGEDILSIWTRTDGGRVLKIR